MIIHLIAKSLVSFLIIILFGLANLNTQVYGRETNPIKEISSDTARPGMLHEEKFVSINGIDQWITIRGERTKPAILFIHGCPGSPISPYSNNVYKSWEKDFIIVQWDQRGTGKTFGVSAPEELTPEFLQSNPLTIQQMTDDGIKLSEYLVQQLGKQKLILFGTSWGSALGVKMATKRPDLYYAYVGHSQIVHPADDLPLYNKVYQLALDKDDSSSLATLKTIGKPPYEQAKKTGLLLRVVKKYERENSEAPPASWFIPAAGYDNKKDNKHREDGDDYSFVNYVGDKGLGVQSIRPTINLMKDNLVFKIPVFLIQGTNDLLTPKEATQAYFNKIKAPEKKFFLLPSTAHGFNLKVVETQYKVFKAIKV